MANKQTMVCELAHNACFLCSCDSPEERLLSCPQSNCSGQVNGIYRIAIVWGNYSTGTDQHLRTRPWIRIMPRPAWHRFQSCTVADVASVDQHVQQCRTLKSSQLSENSQSKTFARMSAVLTRNMETGHRQRSKEKDRKLLE